MPALTLHETTLRAETRSLRLHLGRARGALGSRRVGGNEDEGGDLTVGGEGDDGLPDLGDGRADDRLPYLGNGGSRVGDGSRGLTVGSDGRAPIRPSTTECPDPG